MIVYYFQSQLFPLGLLYTGLSCELLNTLTLVAWNSIRGGNGYQSNDFCFTVIVVISKRMSGMLGNK